MTASDKEFDLMELDGLKSSAGYAMIVDRARKEEAQLIERLIGGEDPVLRGKIQGIRFVVGLRGILMEQARKG